jgi:hypothetical protein
VLRAGVVEESGERFDDVVVGRHRAVGGEERAASWLDPSDEALVVRPVGIGPVDVEEDRLVGEAGGGGMSTLPTMTS